MKWLKEFIAQNKSLLLFICLLACFRGAVADWHPVPTGSMKPTILEGDVVWHNKLAYDLNIPFTGVRLLELAEPERGDVVVVNSTKADKRLIKRLVGLPGDEISMTGNQLMVNGQAAHYEPLPLKEFDAIRPEDTEPGWYLSEAWQGSDPHAIHVRRLNQRRSTHFQTVVPEGQYFLMGDNRDNSADSRYYGTFSRQELRGKATHILLSLNKHDAYKPRLERFFSPMK